LDSVAFVGLASPEWDGCGGQSGSSLRGGTRGERRLVNRRYSTRVSPIHGRGLFALRTLEAGTTLGEFSGRRMTWPGVEEVESAGEGHTFLFELGDGSVLDGGQGGNSLRWLNHGCEPNCEAVQDGARIWIQTTRLVAAGDELLIDYALQIEPGEPQDAHPCHCGAASCRGTMVTS
jgi:SET domain-containing protein